MKKQKPTNGFVSLPAPVVHHEYEPGTPVLLGNSNHQGLYYGQEGTIVARHPTEPGYAVEVLNVGRVGLFGGASFTEPAIIYLEPHEFRLDAARLHQLVREASGREAPHMDEGERGPIVDDSGTTDTQPS